MLAASVMRRTIVARNNARSRIPRIAIFVLAILSKWAPRSLTFPAAHLI